ncbi:MAG: GNAT family N-acetyltransferase [Spirochaetales bacterium]|nr:GNAT family N-acetyltransferase [Spirochaetales bacterium]
MSISIRTADLFCHDDREDLILLLESYKADPMGGGAPYTEEEKSRLLQGLMRHPSCAVYFCYYEGQFAGGAVCFETFATFSARPCINIHDFCVLPSFRKKGLGTCLMKAILKAAETKGAGKVTLEVREDNYDAQRLYRRHGFEAPRPNMLFWSRCNN